MKTWPRIVMSLVAWSCTFTAEKAAADAGVEAAVVAVQQAPDPSGAVAAYASGLAFDRNNVPLLDAYV